MSWAADGQDRNGLQLEKIGHFFKFIALCLGKLAKTIIMVYFISKMISLDLLLVFYKYFMYNKGI